MLYQTSGYSPLFEVDRLQTPRRLAKIGAGSQLYTLWTAAKCFGATPLERREECSVTVSLSGCRLVRLVGFIARQMRQCAIPRHLGMALQMIGDALDQVFGCCGLCRLLRDPGTDLFKRRIGEPLRQ